MREIIFWRHAEAHDATENESDLDRKLTVKGQRNAERVAHWLDRNLPQQCKVFASEAKRAQQTVRCLPRKSKTLADINPEATPDAVLTAIGWGIHSEPIVVVGHQPWIGQCISRLIFNNDDDISVKKGAVWWLQQRSRDEGDEIVVRSVISPDLL
jgi:phosphohistidine phosphatase